MDFPSQSGTTSLCVSVTWKTLFGSQRQTQSKHLCLQYFQLGVYENNIQVAIVKVSLWVSLKESKESSDKGHLIAQIIEGDPPVKDFLSILLQLNTSILR